MAATPARAESTADALLEAHVRWQLDRLGGDHLDAAVRTLADNLLDATGRHQLEDLVDRDAITAIVQRALTTVPGSAAVSGIVELAVDVAHAGPAEPYPLGELVARERVEAVVDELLGLVPVLERGLATLTASPLVGVVASGFMGRIVGEVLSANQAVADKLPGLGSLMSFGTSAASRVMGAADKQLQGLLGDAAGKGGAFAVGRLNKIVVETLRDPTTREAVLQVWDLAAEQQVRGMAGQVSREEVGGLVEAVHELTIDTLATEHVARIVEVVVEGFFDRFGGYTPTELLEELDLDRTDVVTDLVRTAPRVVDALRGSGDLERLLRARLAPFYASPEVRDLLG